MAKYQLKLKSPKSSQSSKKSKKISKSQPTTASTLGEKKAPLSKSKASKKKPTITKTVVIYKNQSDMMIEQDKDWKKKGFATKAIRAGQNPDPIHGGVIPAMDLSSTFQQFYPGEHSGFDYTRCGNPTVMNLQRNLCAMEGGNYALACNAGLAAVISVLSLLGPDDHLLCIDDVYGGTQRYLRDVFGPQTNIAFDMIDMQDVKFVRKNIKKNTKIIWIEAPTNPTMKYPDI